MLISRRNEADRQRNVGTHPLPCRLSIKSLSNSRSVNLGGESRTRLYPMLKSPRRISSKEITISLREGSYRCGEVMRAQPLVNQQASLKRLDDPRQILAAGYIYGPNIRPQAWKQTYIWYGLSGVAALWRNHEKSNKSMKILEVRMLVGISHAKSIVV